MRILGLIPVRKRLWLSLKSVMNTHRFSETWCGMLSCNQRLTLAGVVLRSKWSAMAISLFFDNGTGTVLWSRGFSLSVLKGVAYQTTTSRGNPIQFFVRFACVTRRIVTVFAPVITLAFSWYWSKLLFRSATEVISNHLNPLAGTVFFAACCGLTHSVVYISCIVVGNTRQCLLYVFICCVLQK